MSDRVILTTSSHLEGYRVTEHIDIVSAECVFGMNILKDMFAGFRDFFGGRNKSSQDVLRDARVACLDELRREAAEMGANAVIVQRDLRWRQVHALPGGHRYCRKGR